MVWRDSALSRGGEIVKFTKFMAWRTSALSGGGEIMKFPKFMAWRENRPPKLMTGRKGMAAPAAARLWRRQRAAAVAAGRTTAGIPSLNQPKRYFAMPWAAEPKVAGAQA